VQAAEALEARSAAATVGVLLDRPERAGGQRLGFVTTDSIGEGVAAALTAYRLQVVVGELLRRLVRRSAARSRPPVRRWAEGSAGSEPQADGEMQAPELPSLNGGA